MVVQRQLQNKSTQPRAGNSTLITRKISLQPIATMEENRKLAIAMKKVRKVKHSTKTRKESQKAHLDIVKPLNITRMSIANIQMIEQQQTQQLQQMEVLLQQQDDEVRQHRYEHGQNNHFEQQLDGESQNLMIITDRSQQDSISGIVNGDETPRDFIKKQFGIDSNSKTNKNEELISMSQTHNRKNSQNFFIQNDKDNKQPGNLYQQPNKMRTMMNSTITGEFARQSNTQFNRTNKLQNSEVAVMSLTMVKQFSKAEKRSRRSLVTTQEAYVNATSVPINSGHQSHSITQHPNNPNYQNQNTKATQNSKKKMSSTMANGGSSNQGFNLPSVKAHISRENGSKTTQSKKVNHLTKKESNRGKLQQIMAENHQRKQTQSFDVQKDMMLIDTTAINADKFFHRDRQHTKQQQESKKYASTIQYQQYYQTQQQVEQRNNKNPIQFGVQGGIDDEKQEFNQEGIDTSQLPSPYDIDSEHSQDEGTPVKKIENQSKLQPQSTPSFSELNRNRITFEEGECALEAENYLSVENLHTTIQEVNEEITQMDNDDSQSNLVSDQSNMKLSQTLINQIQSSNNDHHQSTLAFIPKVQVTIPYHANKQGTNKQSIKKKQVSQTISTKKDKVNMASHLFPSDFAADGMQSDRQQQTKITTSDRKIKVKGSVPRKLTGRTNSLMLRSASRKGSTNSQYMLVNSFTKQQQSPKYQKEQPLFSAEISARATIPSKKYQKNDSTSAFVTQGQKQQISPFRDLADLNLLDKQEDAQRQQEILRLKKELQCDNLKLNKTKTSLQNLLNLNKLENINTNNRGVQSSLDRKTLDYNHIQKSSKNFHQKKDSQISNQTSVLSQRKVSNVQIGFPYVKNKFIQVDQKQNHTSNSGLSNKNKSIKNHRRSQSMIDKAKKSYNNLTPWDSQDKSNERQQLQDNELGKHLSDKLNDANGSPLIVEQVELKYEASSDDKSENSPYAEEVYNSKVNPFVAGSSQGRKAVFSQQSADQTPSSRMILLNQDLRLNSVIQNNMLNEDLSQSQELNDEEETKDSASIHDQQKILQALIAVSPNNKFLNQQPSLNHAIKVEQNNNNTANNTATALTTNVSQDQQQFDFKMTQGRLDNYNQQVRERHMKSFKKRQEKQEQLRKSLADQRAQENAKDPMLSPEDSDEDKNDDIYEVIQKKKINQKFSKLMSFDIEKSFSQTQNLIGSYQQMQQNINNMSAQDNMRLNQRRFKNDSNKQQSESALRFSNLVTAGSIQKKLPQKSNQNKSLRVRFSLDRPETGNQQQQPTSIATTSNNMEQLQASYGN